MCIYVHMCLFVCVCHTRMLIDYAIRAHSRTRFASKFCHIDRFVNARERFPSEIPSFRAALIIWIIGIGSLQCSMSGTLNCTARIPEIVPAAFAAPERKHSKTNSWIGVCLRFEDVIAYYAIPFVCSRTRHRDATVIEADSHWHTLACT